MTGIVECANLSFTYKTRTAPSLKNINLSIDSGDFILLTGPTGCGKSTLLKALNGLIPHEIGGELTGELRINGVDSRQSSVAELSRTVGLMFQNPDDQIFSTTVADEVGFALENMGMEREMIRRRVAETLAWVGLAGRENGSVHALSGGERQRLALAAVLAVRPRLLALDEPISQMDPRGAVELLAVLQKLNRDQGISIIVVEHRHEAWHGDDDADWDRLADGHLQHTGEHHRQHDVRRVLLCAGWAVRPDRQHLQQHVHGGSTDGRRVGFAEQVRQRVPDHDLDR